VLTVDEAIRRILPWTPIQPVESVALDHARGRVLAEEVAGALDLPRWDCSSMDGYAVRASDTADGEVSLRLLETVGAGSMPGSGVAPGLASMIATGAPLPAGADAVVPIEDTDGARTGAVKVRGRARPGQHVRRRGEDVRRSMPLLSSGTRLGAGHLGLLASQGITSVLVVRRPVVAVLSTGNEVVEPGKPLGPGQIYGANNAVLRALVEDLGAVGVDAGVAVDDVHSIVTRLQYCLGEADVVITTGGVSVGPFDDVKRAFDLLGARLELWKVAMQPGKPLAFGVVEQTGRSVPIFGLPGNPASAGVGFHQFVRPMLLTAMGVHQPYLPILPALLAADVRMSPGRAKFVRARLEWTDSGLVARPLANGSSGSVASLADAQGLVLLPPQSEGAREGDRVRVQILDSGFLARTTPGYPW
jgi:molybdopterin molybdotransferase